MYSRETEIVAIHSIFERLGIESQEFRAEVGLSIFRKDDDEEPFVKVWPDPKDPNLFIVDYVLDGRAKVLEVERKQLIAVLEELVETNLN